MKRFSSDRARQQTALLAAFCISALLTTFQAAAGIDPLGNQFIAFHSFANWKSQPGETRKETVLTSPEIWSKIKADELILSWNATAPDSTWLVLEARAIYMTGPTKWYGMGRWTMDDTRHPRECVLDQADDQGNVSTDTLILKQPADRFQVRVTLRHESVEQAKLKFLSLALTDTRVHARELPQNKSAWGRVLPVPERSQMPYPNGNVICSPTTVSMIMGFWAKKLARPELDRTVPEVAAAVYDKNWKGTGNWTFNTAYAGSFDGMRAYVTRMSDVAELEGWIKAGIPVGLSLCYDLLRGRPSRSNGHLVVLVGFTPSGNPIINDPGTSENVRKVFTRKNLIKAWNYSRNAAYLIYPDDFSVPTDRHGHWDSWTAHKQIVTENPIYK